MLRPVLLLLSVATSAVAANPPPPRWEAMDYGPFLSSSVTMPSARNGEDVAGIVMKGITVPLLENGKVIGAACFDTMLCRWAGAWTQPNQAPAERLTWSSSGPPLLKLMGTPFDGTHRPPEGSRPRALGVVLFQNRALPGWAKAEEIADPRSNPYVPLPRDWAHYTGLTVHGSEVLLRYHVQGTEVQERVALRRDAGLEWFERVLRLGPTSRARQVLITEVPDAATLTQDFSTTDHVEFRDESGAGMTQVRWQAEKAVCHWKSLQHQLCLEIPPLTEATQIRVALWHGPVTQTPTPDQWEKTLGAKGLPAAAQMPDLAALAQAGAAQPATEIITTLQRGKEDAAYVVDTLPLPEKNPAQSWMRPGGFDFFSDGNRAALSTWSGEVWLVRGLLDPAGQLHWQRIASGLFQPLGLKIVQDQIYVLGRDQITRLHDENQDGATDYYENFNNDVSCTPNFHEFATDLHTGPDGSFYFVKGAPLLGADFWDPAGPHNGCLLQVAPDGSELKVVATGLRAPNGCGVGPHGELTTGDNEGIWTPVCRINWVQPGMFLGAVGMDHRATRPTSYDPPLCWVPYAVDNSAAGQVWASDKFGALSGELLHLSYGKCTVFHVLRDPVGGVMQGGVVKLPWKLESSAMRGRTNPVDGSLYLCGLRGWQTTATHDGALHRIRATGQAFETVTGLKVGRATLTVTVNVPLDPASVHDLSNWSVQQWNYRWTEKYGSDLYSANDPNKKVGKKGELSGEAMEIEKVELGPDGRTVVLHLPKLQPVMQMMTKANLRTAAGQPFPVEIYHTINVIP